MRGWRDDIQALRAFAVIAVIAFHLGVPGCDRGYLGVDVFFVISGYLIGGRLELLAGAQGLSGRGLQQFWRARVVRLWPAAVVTLALVTPAAALLLDAHEWRLYLWQLAGAAGLAANGVLWQQTDYFGGGAGTKLLLHFWSLAVEEQFYLLAPLLFMLPRAGWRRLAIALASLASLALMLVLTPRSPSAAFYFLPTRGWELGMGVMLALGGPVPEWIARVLRPLRGVAWIGLALVVASAPLLTDTTALLVSAILAAWLVAVPGRPGPRWIAAIGDRSYALYLVHWPIIALAANVWLTGTPASVRAALVVPIGLAAEALWRLVDGRDRARRRAWVWVVAQGLLLAGALLLTLVRPGVDTAFREANEGLGLACNPSGPFDLARACRSAPQADTVVWGDSFAMQLVPGLAATVPHGVIQATRVVCAPLDGLAPIGPGFSADWAARCIGWNDAVLASVARDPAIRVVVMAGIFNQLVAGASPGWRFGVRRGAGVTVQPQDDAVLTRALLATIDRLQRAGKQVVLYRPQPYPDYDVGLCLSRRAEALPAPDVSADCGFDRTAAAPASHAVDGFFDRLLIRNGTAMSWRLIDPDGVLCPNGHCRAQQDGVALFADRVHLSRGGSLWVAQKLDLGRLLAAGRGR